MPKSNTNRSKLPRKSSPAGIDARLEARISGYEPITRDGNGNLCCRNHKPGSRNPRKH